MSCVRGPRSRKIEIILVNPVGFNPTDHTRIRDFRRFKMRVMAIWERVGDALQREWIDKSRKGLVEGVQVDIQRRQLRVPCILTQQNEVIPVAKMDRRPDWFRLSVRVPSWKKVVAVTDSNKILYPIEKEGYKLLFFRNATVLEFSHGMLSASYYAVRTEGSRFFLVESSRFELEIPRFIETREGIKQFLLENHIPVDLLDSALELIQNQKKDFSNPSWKEGLEKSKLQVRPSSKAEVPKKEVEPAPKESQEIPEVPAIGVEEERPRRSPKRQERREREDKPRRPRPHREVDHSEFKRARGLSLKDFQN